MNEIELQSSRSTEINIDDDLIPEGVERSDDDPTALQNQRNLRTSRSESISIFKRPSGASYQEPCMDAVSDAEVQATLARIRKCMFYLSYACYGVTNLNRSEDTTLSLNVWIYRINVGAAALNICSASFFILGNSHFTLITYAVYFLFFLNALFSIAFIEHGVRFGAEMAESMHVEKVQEEILKSALNNYEKKHLFSYLGYTQLVSTMMYLYSTVLSLYVGTNLLKISSVPFFAILYLMSVPFLNLKFFVNSHQGLTWAWLVYCRQEITRVMVLQALKSEKNVDIDLSQDPATEDTVRCILSGHIEDFYTTSMIWKANGTYRMILFIFEVLFSGAIVGSYVSAAGGVEIIVFELISSSLLIFFPTLFSLIVTGMSNNSFYTMVAEYAVDDQVDPDSRVGLQLSKVLRGEGEAGYKVCLLYITSKEVILLATIMFNIYRGAILAAYNIDND